MQNFNTVQTVLTAQGLLQPPVPVVQMSCSQAAQNSPGLKTLLELCDLITRRTPKELPMRGVLVNPSFITGDGYLSQRGAVLLLNLPGAYEPLLAQLLSDKPDIAYCYGINSTRVEESAIWSARLAEAIWEVRIDSVVLAKLINANRGSSDCAAVWVPVIFVAGNSLCAGGFWATSDWELGCSYSNYVVDDRDWTDVSLLTDSDNRDAFPWRWAMWQSALGIQTIFADTVDWYEDISDETAMKSGEASSEPMLATADEALLPVF